MKPLSSLEDKIDFPPSRFTRPSLDKPEPNCLWLMGERTGHLP